ncbi:hypothetical protein HanIR_Chr12g0575931 [Helianthus annuus]|nr:hypothetical protein HanIR_Chr12g0575931 [Helianthus annuus]
MISTTPYISSPKENQPVFRCEIKHQPMLPSPTIEQVPISDEQKMQSNQNKVRKQIWNFRTCC